MAKRIAILNLISVVTAIFVSYYTQAIQLNGNTMTSLSQKYHNLFTPAGYAFAIWGVIFLALLVMSIYQIYQAFGPKTNLRFLRQSGYWFAAANFLNAAWTFAWFYELTGLSVILMVLILFSLLKIVVNTNMERWDAPFKTIALSWWPICLYSGWIAVALIANSSAYLVKINWNGWFFDQVQWTIALIFIATLINIVMVHLRNMREFAAVGIWALIAIYVRQHNIHESIATTAMAGAVLIFLNVAYHGFINRRANPISKLFKS